MSYSKSAVAALIVGMIVFTVVAMAAFVSSGGIESTGQFIGLAFNTMLMIGLGALPFVFAWIAIMPLLEARLKWASKPWVWIFVALVVSAPAQLFLVGLTNMGDPAPGTEKLWSWDALWAATPATIFGAFAGWWWRHHHGKLSEAKLEAAADAE